LCSTLGESKDIQQQIHPHRTKYSTTTLCAKDK
jgi:hypothetical protein